MRILVVEDEDEIAEFMLRGLREEGFVVDRAADRDTAWHALTTGKWDAVLLDLSLALRLEVFAIEAPRVRRRCEEPRPEE